jgi:cytochrome c553
MERLVKTSIKGLPATLVFLCVALAGMANPLTKGEPAKAAGQADDFPAFAYPWAPDFPTPPVDDIPRHVLGSSSSFTTRQELDLFFSPDWHPADHPPMPDVVAHGDPPQVRACGSCHRAEGTGGPENASLAGLPAEYIVQQMADFKSGARKFSGPQRIPITLMIDTARAASDAEVQAAANYFSALKPKPIIKVVESDMAPRTELARVFYKLDPKGGTEPLGRRIVEVPADAQQFELRDSRSQFIAYVPKGAVARGEALVKGEGAGAPTPCGACHSPDLTGGGPIPGIAGRSPSYIVRQLYDIKTGARAGAASAIMRPIVEKLSTDDMIAIASYLATREP